MFDFSAIDPTLDADPDPLKLAEDRVAEAEDACGLSRYNRYAGRSSIRDVDDARKKLASARADLEALRAKLAAEADDELPYR